MDETVSLKEYFETKIEALEKATSLAAKNMETRLEGMNEFRAQLKDQTGTFITKAEHSAVQKAVADDIQSLRESRATGEGKASQQSVVIAFVLTGISMLIGILGFLIAIVNLILRFMGI